MIRLRLLGATELVRADGTEVTNVLQQPKRLAVLALLAAGGDGRWHRRDTLLGTFWPDMDDAHARAALRRTLTFLRTYVGDAAIRTRGDEVGIAADGLWCDLPACEAALREGRLADAMDLYRGDVLAGLHVPSAPEFERWLDTARERLRRETSDAAARLAADAEGAGRLAEAAAWRRRALEIRPDDETGLRRLLVLLDRLGDRAGAIRAYDDFAHRLAQDLDLTPSAETTALVAGIRARAEAAPAAATPPATRPAPNVVAVFPFAVRGAADLHYLREGMVDLISTKLDGAGDLRTVDPGSVLARAAALGAAPPDPAAVRPIAGALGAGTFVLGSVVADGERILLRATIHETLGTAERRVDAEATAAAGIFDVVDDLVRRLLASQTQSLGGHLTRLGAMTTDSLPALRAYLDGERAFRRGRAHESRAAYEGAAELDPDFALASYRLAAAHAACGNPVGALQAVEHATAGARRLNPHTRLLLAALTAVLEGRLTDAERHCQRLLADRPDDVEAWYRLARVLLDGNRFRARPEAEARIPLERTCALDPRHVAALGELARLTWATGDRQAARDYARQYLALSPDGDDAPVMAVIGQTDDAPGRLAVARPAALRQVAALEILGAAVPAVAGPVASGPWPSLLAAHAAAARNAHGEARAALARAAQFDRDLALDHEAFLATMPGRLAVGGDTLADRLRARAAEAGVTSGTTPAAALRTCLTLHSLGLLHVAQGDRDAAAACARACALAAVPPWAASLPPALRAGIEARAALERDDPPQALAALDTIALGPWMHVAGEVPECALVAERLLRARVLAALGRQDEAGGWRTPPAMLRPLEWAIGTA
ncbi:MAG TPA: BTAD domain-containing putative transcriptional regulator [Gemmatimonadales bacterium]